MAEAAIRLPPCGMKLVSLPLVCPVNVSRARFDIISMVLRETPRSISGIVSTEPGLARSRGLGVYGFVGGEFRPQRGES